jgi:hypothetical protein
MSALFFRSVAAPGLLLSVTFALPVAPLPSSSQVPSALNAGPAVGVVPTLDAARRIITQYHPWFVTQGIPGERALLTVVVSARGELERSALTDKLPVNGEDFLTPDFLAKQFPEVLMWDLQSLSGGSTGTLSDPSLGPHPVTVIWMVRT